MGGSKVNEKDLVILEQYDLHVQSTRRGRGSFLCDTDRGLVQVTEFSGSQERLFFQNRVLSVSYTHLTLPTNSRV